MNDYTNAAFPPAIIAQCREQWNEWGSLYAMTNFETVSTSVSEVVITQPSMWSRLFGRNQPNVARSNPNSVGFTLAACPAAFRIAQLATTGVFSSQPSITHDDGGIQAVIDSLTDNDFFSMLREAETLNSVFGGVFLKLEWNLDSTSAVVKAFPVSPAIADPVWRNGELEAVSFIYAINTNGNKVYRLVETHEVVDGEGIVRYNLYSGTGESFGLMVPYSDNATADRMMATIPLDADLGDGYRTGLDELDVVYVRNIKSKIDWSSTPAANYGASDFYGAEGSMLELNSITSQRDEEMRVAKSRILLDEKFAQHEPGQGMVQDVDRAVFTLMHTPEVPPEQVALQQPLIQHIQGEIRNSEFKIAIEDAWRKIAAASGFSLASLDVTEDATGVQTATGVRASTQATDDTIATKRGEWSAALEQLVTKMVRLWCALHGKATAFEPVTVKFIALSRDETETANIISQYRAAGVMSLRQALRTIHPDWSEEQVNDELLELRQEAPMGVSDANDIAPVNDPTTGRQ